MIKQLNLSVFFSIAIMSLLVCACGENRQVQHVRNEMFRIKNTTKNQFLKKNDFSDLLSPKAVEYHTKATRSPFEAVSAGKHGEAGTLADYPITALRFVGVLTEGNKLAAYVMVPGGMVYQVSVGDPIGNHAGKVVAINPDRLQVSEQNSEEDIVTQRIVTLQLKEGSQ